MTETERRQEIVLSKKDLERLRDKDPDLHASVSQWEQAFKRPVRVSKMDDGTIHIRPQEGKK